MGSLRARFVALITAIESATRPQLRSREARAHVATLIEATKGSGLSAGEREALVGGLRNLEHESTALHVASSSGCTGGQKMSKSGGSVTERGTKWCTEAACQMTC